MKNAAYCFAQNSPIDFIDEQDMEVRLDLWLHDIRYPDNEKARQLPFCPLRASRAAAIARANLRIERT